LATRTHARTSSRLPGRMMAGTRLDVEKVAVSAAESAAGSVSTCSGPTIFRHASSARVRSFMPPAGSGH
jgi:hypothetical protein